MKAGIGLRRPDLGESGVTLIELLVTVVIMGLAFVIIVGGIGTAIIGSDVQKNQAGADVALRTAAENLTYQPCAVVGTYTPTPAPGFTVTVTRVSHWNSGTNRFADSLPAGCSGPLPNDTGLQLVELEATADSRRQAEPKTLQVVKRRP